jgi:acyl-CoA synthetase (AMP-forming)/AMP-acid ligase II
MIMRGGEKIYPADIERVLHAHPGIAEAAVIGVADDYWGERVAAFVVPRRGETLSEQEVLHHCRQHLAGYKNPSSVIFTERLPKNAAGKIMKQLLRIGDVVDYRIGDVVD